MIKNILFDMGNVLVCWNPDLFIERLCLPAEDSRLLMNEVFRSVEWIQLDRGTLTDEEALSRMYPRLPERLHSAARQLVTSWEEPMVPMPSSAMFIDLLLICFYLAEECFYIKNTCFSVGNIVSWFHAKCKLCFL